MLSAVLGVAAIGDWLTGQGLADHAATIEAPDGGHTSPNLLYGLLVAVAIVGTGHFLFVVRAVHTRRRSAPALALGAVLTTATLAIALLVSTEYDQRIFPPLWGGLALLAPAAGTRTVVSLIRHRDPRPTTPDSPRLRHSCDWRSSFGDVAMVEAGQPDGGQCRGYGDEHHYRENVEGCGGDGGDVFER